MKVLFCRLILHRRASTAAAPRTINLALRPGTCERPRRVQKLVAGDLGRPCPHTERVPSGYQPTRVYPVRVCRRSDLERSCQPKLCDCPQKPPARTTGQIVCGLTILGAKGVLAAGLIYWSVAEGVWGDCNDTEDFYRRVKETVANDPALTDTQLPRLDYMKFKILDTYNRTVLAVIGTLVQIPREWNKQIRDRFFPCEPVEEDDTKKKKK